jgi:hypothetical protein
MKDGKPVARTATTVLIRLWEGEFFRTWKLRSAIEADLAKHGYHFSGPELGMALMRARHLTRRGRRGKYEYIQKYPYEGEPDKTESRGAKRKRS